DDRRVAGICRRYEMRSVQLKGLRVVGRPTAAEKQGLVTATEYEKLRNLIPQVLRVDRRCTEEDQRCRQQSKAHSGSRVLV
ncbi:MAG TPA: hypothetical protein VFB89_15225, partial [Gemmatimonadales bacterium]|nr:hypothetical protein [Gemmatimonadales bacterium]